MILLSHCGEKSGNAVIRQDDADDAGQGVERGERITDDNDAKYNSSSTFRMVNSGVSSGKQSIAIHRLYDECALPA